jgi:hypothetical protein
MNNLNYIRNIWWDLFIENSCLELYVEISSIFFFIIIIFFLLLSNINILAIGFHKVSQYINWIFEYHILTLESGTVEINLAILGIDFLCIISIL